MMMMVIYGCVVILVVVQQGGATAAGAWSRAAATSVSGGGGELVTGLRLDPRVETSVDAYCTLNRLLTDYIEHVSIYTKQLHFLT